MRIAEINMISYGSTGNIMLQIGKCAKNRGHSVRTYSTNVFDIKYKKRSFVAKNHKYFGTYFENGIHYILGSKFGKNGEFSFFGTLQLINDLKRFKPDIIHLHNLHKFCICLPMLFNYIKKNNIKVVWTLHDCWAFTGKCTHFTMAKCEKWKIGCYDCPQRNCYPKSKKDNSKKMYELKKKWFQNVKDMVIVTPSNWLASLVKESFLKEYPIKVINNGIDILTFKPTESDFREKYNCKDKYIILGVAFGWGKGKGIDVFDSLSKSIPKNYQIVLVGTDEYIDSKLPENIISIHKTQNQEELAKIYTAADVFVNPTREEVLGLVNIEALSCGTPVVTFKTGGSVECIDESCGSIVECDDLKNLENEILRICEEKPFSKDACINRAKKFDKKDKFLEYVKLYEDILNNL